MQLSRPLFWLLGIVCLSSFLSSQPVVAQTGVNGKIVFNQSPNGTAQIFIVNADGSGFKQLTNTAGNSKNYPKWSPDGTKIAFSSVVINEAIFVMNADGSNVRQLTNGNPGSDRRPVWSPDGSKIAFLSSRDGADSKIYVMNADGSNVTPLSSNPKAAGTHLSWSPDGQKIAFTRIEPGGDFGQYDIHVINADGTNLKNLTNSLLASDYYPEWSPDGSRIAFSSLRNQKQNLYLMNSDGTNERQLTQNVSTNGISWAPDASKIVFSGFAGGVDTAFHLYTINPDGSELTRIPNTIRSDDPSWQRIKAGVQFSNANFNASEGDARASLMVARIGDTSVAASFSYATIDNPAAVPCDPTVRDANGNLYPPGTSYARCDYATSIDTVTFAAGDSAPKTITIPLVDDAHVEGAETFQVRLTGAQGAVLGAVETATVTINDNDAAGQTNPIFDNGFFVRMQYLDFLSREPEAGEPWTNVLNKCSDVNNNPACDRLTVSSAFFRSTEFQLKGLYVYFFYRATLNRRPTYDEIITDMRSITGITPEEVYQKRAAYAEAFIARQQFNLLYGGLSNQAFVDALLRRYSLQQITTEDPAAPDGAAQVTLTRQQLVDGIAAGTLTRAQVVRSLVQSNEAEAAEYNGAFVAMQYYGYLRRVPDNNGFNNWLTYLNANPTDYRTMVKGFATSVEYQLRFGRAQ